MCDTLISTRHARADGVAFFSKVRVENEGKLIGMDLIRLVPERGKFSSECFAKAGAVKTEWLKCVESSPARSNNAWNKNNREAKLPAFQS